MAGLAESPAAAATDDAVAAVAAAAAAAAEAAVSAAAVVLLVSARPLSASLVGGDLRLDDMALWNEQQWSIISQLVGGTIVYKCSILLI